MRVPVKLNQALWPRVLTGMLPSAADPRVLSVSGLADSEFSDAVSTFRFGRTFKTTGKARFLATIEILSSLQYETPPVILDVGASDGVTSLDVMKATSFEHYFVTDAHMTVFSSSDSNRTYYYAADGQCILIVTPAWIVYQDTHQALAPLGAIARSFYSRAPKLGAGAEEITLVNPVLKANLPPNVSIQQYDILQEWPYGKVDLVIAANILNRGYFSEDELKKALTNLAGALNGHGRLALIENRDIEKATVFRLTAGRASVEHRLNGGSEIERLVVNLSLSVLRPERARTF